MKIAIAKESDKVPEHGGHCQAYAGYTIAGSQDMHQVIRANPCLGPGNLPTSLAGMPATHVPSRGTGQKEIEHFWATTPNVLLGTRGMVENAIRQGIAGKDSMRWSD